MGLNRTIGWGSETRILNQWRGPRSFATQKAADPLESDIRGKYEERHCDQFESNAFLALIRIAVSQTGSQSAADQNGGDRFDAGVDSESDDRYESGGDARRDRDRALNDVIGDCELGQPILAEWATVFLVRCGSTLGECLRAVGRAEVDFKSGRLKQHLDRFQQVRQLRVRE
ncbi:hypothetical protein [Cryobacterium cheniae]|uniref:hypothetical protein n=1 Tax=Cryobacterium cheniae TaxID=1259262 RepID=UPI00141A6B99|nr:hypothetical protein [Cryobacterium cheniae]